MITNFLHPTTCERLRDSCPCSTLSSACGGVLFFACAGRTLAARKGVP
jgi:hypothetical protein